MNQTYKILSKILIIALGIVVLFPLYICLIYAFKARTDFVFGILGPPSYLFLGNFRDVIFKNTRFLNALKNSILVTIPTALILQIICATCSYVLARNNNTVCKIIYGLFLASILIPFQSIMLPLYLNLMAMNLINNLFGFIIVKVGFTIAFSCLIITSFVKTIPVVLEEAASIDGAGRFATFWRIVFPMMLPVNISVFVLNALFTWNDFSTALVILQRTAVRTLPLAQYAFFGEQSTDLHGAFTFAALSMIPMVLIYLFFQRYIFEGITSGAVKG